MNDKEIEKANRMYKEKRKKYVKQADQIINTLEKTNHSHIISELLVEAYVETFEE